MAIRIPPKAGIDERNAWLDVEDRLRKLESKEPVKISEKSETPTGSDDPDLEIDGDLVVNNDVTIDGSVDAPHLYDGLIKVVPTAIGSEAQRTINMAASLAIAPGGLSADNVRCRNLFAIRPSCMVYRSAAQTISHNTYTDMLWTHEWHDSHGMHSVSSNTDRITVPEGGVYIAGGHLLWNSNTTGDRNFFITVNGVAGTGNAVRYLNVFADTTDNPYGRMSGSVLLSLGAGDILRMEAIQTSGGNLDTLDTAATGPRGNGMWCVKVSD